jgi:ribosomal protein S13
MLALLDDLSLTEVILLLGVASVVITRLLEATGKTRTSKILREENGDLTNRIRTLEAEKLQRIENELRLTARIDALEEKVKDLQTRDQAAVLAALSEHEIRAQHRADLSEAADNLRHDAAMLLFQRIASATEESAK